MPRTKRSAGFHRRKYRNQSRLISPALEDLLNPFLFAKIVLPHEFHLQPVLLRQSLGVLTQFFPKRFGPMGIIENPDSTAVQESGHRRRMTDIRQRSGYDDSVKTRYDSFDLIRMAFDK